MLLPFNIIIQDKAEKCIDLGAENVSMSKTGFRLALADFDLTKKLQNNAFHFKTNQSARD